MHSHAQTITFPAIDPTRHEYVFSPGDSLGPFTLPHPYLLHESDSLVAGERLLVRGRDYRLDEIPGTLWLLSPQPGVELFVKYNAAPLALDRRLFRMEMKELQSDSQTIVPTLATVDQKQAAGAASGEVRLNRSGSLLRAVTVGTGQDVGIESALRLEIDGNVSRDVELRAVLSDQTTGIPPEGNTKTLREFDRIYLQAKSPSYAVTMGDYELGFGGGNRFLTTTRNVQGADFQWKKPRLGAQASGAITRSKYRSLTITGTEGNQGPYVLTDDEKNINVPVVPGSERVYVDGVEVVRGETDGYIIDYSTGELTFTPRKPIHDDSRIVIEYETIPGNYNRSIVAVQQSGRTPGKIFEWGVGLFREADDTRNPVGVELDGAARAALQAAGGNAGNAVYSGVKYVGAGNGDYVRIDSTDNGSPLTFYRFVAPDTSTGNAQGEYQISFTRFAGAGDYNLEFNVEAARTIYVFIGTGAGDYLPLVRVPLPQQHDVLGVRSTLRPFDGAAVSMESAFSQFDANTLSDRNGKGIRGGALQVDAGYRAPDNDGYSKWQSKLTYRELEAGFRSPAKSTSSEEYRRWGSTDTLGTAGEVTREVSASFAPIKPLRISGSGGDQVRGDGSQSQRWNASTQWMSQLLSAYTSIDRIHAKYQSGYRTDWWYGNHTQRWQFGKVSPSYTTRFEDRRNVGTTTDDGSRRWDHHLATTVQGIGAHTFSTAFDRRDDWNRSGESLTPALRSIGIDFNHARSGDLITTASEYHHRETRYLSADSLIVTDLLATEGAARTSGGGVNGEWKYTFNRTRTSKLTLFAYEVPLGQGDHIRVGDQFIPDPEGDWIVYTRPSGEYEPVLEVRATAGIRIDWSRVKRYRIPGVTTDTRIEIVENNTSSNTLPVLLLQIQQFLKANTLYGKQELRQDIAWEPIRKQTYRLRWNISRERENRWSGGGQDRRFELFALRYHHAKSQRFSWSVETQREWSRRNYVIATTASRDALYYRLLPGLVYREGRVHEWLLDAALQYAKDRSIPIDWREFGITPGYSYLIGTAGRINTEVEWRSVITSAKTLPYDISSGRQPGSNWRWQLRGDYRLGTNVTGSLFYRGIKDNATPVRHEGRAEVIAFF